MAQAFPLLAFALFAAAPAVAQTLDVPRRAPFTPGPPVVLPECTCRAAGMDRKLGETVCLATPSGPRLATCVMELNLTSWRLSDVPCASSDMSRRTLAAILRSGR